MEKKLSLVIVPHLTQSEKQIEILYFHDHVTKKGFTRSFSFMLT